jgi:hypothetical protein
LLSACDEPTGDDGPLDVATTTDTSTTPVPTDLCDGHPDELVCDGNHVVTCDAAGDELSRVPCDTTTTCADGVCVACTPDVWSVPIGDAGVIAATGLVLDVDTGVLGTELGRSRTVVANEEAVLTLDGPVEAFLADGTPLTSGSTVTGAFQVRATAIGTGTLTLDDAVCAGTLAVTGIVPAPIAARPLDTFPWFEHVDLYTELDEVWAALDPLAYPDRAGLPFDVWVVPERSRAAWAADPTIDAAGVTVGPVPATVPSGADGVLLLADPVPGPGMADRSTIVLDFDGDGLLGPDDLVDGLGDAGFAVVGDLSLPGPYTPVQAEKSFDFWHTFLMYWPSEVDTLDPIPLVVVSHGNGHDYTWYDYLGFHFASWGYAVIVHRNDTADTSIEPAASTTWTNTEAFLANLASIGGGVLESEIDADRIAWIGHSRGGEGVVIAYDWLFDGSIAPTTFDVTDLKLVSSIAPTVWTSPDIANPHDVFYHQLDGSADGDVTGSVSNGIGQYFRLFQRATGTRMATYVHGASHNDFNCCGFFDATGPDLVGRAAAQQLAKTFYLALLGATFDGRAELLEVLTRDPVLFRTPGVTPIIASQVRRADGDRVFVIEDYQSNPTLDLSSSGTQVSYDVANLVEDKLDDNDLVFTPSLDDAMNGMTQSEGDSLAARGAVFEWDVGDDLSYEVDIVASEQDWTDDTFVSFRACQGTRHPFTVALDAPLTFGVEIEDSRGVTSQIPLETFGAIPSPYPRTGDGVGAGWANEFQSVRIPVAAFAADGRTIDLASVTTLRLLFGQNWGSPQGRLGLDDLELVREVSP